MKVALLSDGITPFVIGGMQKHSYNLAKYLTIRGVQVTLFHFENNNKIISNKHLNTVILVKRVNIELNHSV